MLNIRGQTDYPISGSGADYLIAFPTSVIIGAFCAIILDEKAASRRKRLNTTALDMQYNFLRRQKAWLFNEDPFASTNRKARNSGTEVENLIHWFWWNSF